MTRPLKPGDPATLAKRKKWAARRQVAVAVKRGQLEPLPCEDCQAMPVEAHHDDYEKPLAVRWLCRLHHLNLHGYLN